MTGSPFNVNTTNLTNEKLELGIKFNPNNSVIKIFIDSSMILSFNIKEANNGTCCQND